MSDEDQPTTVQSMTRASVAPEGTYAEMDLVNSDGSTQLLRFNPTTLLGFVSKVFQLFLNERIQTSVATGHQSIQPLQVAVAASDAAVGGRAVIVSMRLDTGLPVDFALPPAEAEELHRQIGKAVKKARRQSAAGRH